MNKNVWLSLLIIFLCIIGCDHSSDGGSTTFLDNGSEGTPVTGIPAPTPFTPSPSNANITITPSDLNVITDTTHTFSVNITGVAGNGAFASTNAIAASSGSVFGLPISIFFTELVAIGPASYLATGTFSGPLNGVGTINVNIIYSEDSLTISEVFVFTIAGSFPGSEICDDGIDNDFDGDTDCADSDCNSSPLCCSTPTSLDLTNGLGAGASVSTLGIGCASGLEGYVSEIELTGAFNTNCPMSITTLAWDHSPDSSSSPEPGYSGSVTLIVLVGDGTGSTPGVEIGRQTVPPATALPGVAGTITYTLSPAITVPAGTTAVYIGFETVASSTTDPYYTGFDDTLATSEVDTYVFGSCIGTGFILADTLIAGNYNFTMTVLGSP